MEGDQMEETAEGAAAGGVTTRFLAIALCGGGEAAYFNGAGGAARRGLRGEAVCERSCARLEGWSGWRAWAGRRALKIIGSEVTGTTSARRESTAWKGVSGRRRIALATRPMHFITLRGPPEPAGSWILAGFWASKNESGVAATIATRTGTRGGVCARRWGGAYPPRMVLVGIDEGAWETAGTSANLERINLPA